MIYTPFIENETPEDLTARMLRRKSIQEVEDLASIEGVWANPQRSFIVDRDFLFTHGYTVDEWFEASMGVRVKKAVTQINDGLQKQLKARLTKKNK